MATTKENLMSFQKAQLSNPYLHSGALLVLIAIFVWFILLPKYHSYSESNSNLQKSKAQKETLVADSKELNRLIAQLEASGEDIKLLDEALPLADRATKTTVLIENYAISSGMQLAQVNIDKIDENIAAADASAMSDRYAKNRKLASSNMTVSLTGSVEQFRNFLELLEKSGRIIDVSNLEVASSESLIKYTVTLKTYSYLIK